MSNSYAILAAKLGTSVVGRKSKRFHKTSEPEVLNKNKDELVVYTDGACLSNGDDAAVGAYAVFFGDGDKRNGAFDLDTLKRGKDTNNDAEWYALLKVFQLVPEEQKLVVRSDSTNVVNTMNCWLPAQKSRGWKTVNNEPLKNVEVIKQVDALWTPTRQRNTRIEWVRSHSGIYGNECANTLAQQHARRRQNLLGRTS